jgi:glycosyltransferase involved in cell wall biosynthesis
VPESGVVAAFVGRLDPQKGVDSLLRAMASLRARGAGAGAGGGGGVRLVLAGEGPQRRELESLVAELRLGGAVRLLGFVQDVRSVLSAADLLVMPSRWEGFGLAAGEAMAAGLPVIAGRAAGLRELVVEGETGLLVGADEPEEIARSIELLAYDPARRLAMGQAGERRVAESFAIERNVSTHERLYLSLSSQEKERTSEIF